MASHSKSDSTEVKDVATSASSGLCPTESTSDSLAARRNKDACAICLLLLALAGKVQAARTPTRPVQATAARSRSPQVDRPSTRGKGSLPALPEDTRPGTSSYKRQKTPVVVVTATVTVVVVALLDFSKVASRASIGSTMLSAAGDSSSDSAASSSSPSPSAALSADASADPSTDRFTSATPSSPPS